MKERVRVVPNEEVEEVTIEVPEGHRHLRTTLRFSDGTRLALQEATVANIVRGYVTVKTHPTATRVRLAKRRVDNPKTGYAEWQLVEDEED